MEQEELLRLSRNYIRRAAAEMGLGNAAFCDRVGIRCMETLRRWMYGNSVPRVEMLLRIEQLSGVRTDDCGLRLHSAMDCVRQIRATAYGGVCIKHIAQRCEISVSTIKLVLDGRNPSALSLLTMCENWVEKDCTRWFAGEEYKQNLEISKKPKVRSRDDAVEQYVRSIFGTEIAKGVVKHADDAWNFCTDQFYKCEIWAIGDSKYRFQAVFIPTNRASVERVVRINA